MTIENVGNTGIERNTDMSDGSATYSISLRKKFSELEIDCVNLGGVNETILDYKKIKRV